MTIKRLCTGIVVAMLLFSLVLMYLVQQLEENHLRLQASYENLHRNHLLVDELRQSSDDLTRFVRSYVLTGETRYKQYYFDVLAIRNGEKARPLNYDRAYWDFVIDEGGKPRGDGVVASLQSLMHKADIKEDELRTLQLAQQYSDALVKLEMIAIHALEGVFLDANERFIVNGEPDFELAKALVFNQKYHREKAKIMRPIDSFSVLIDRRLDTEIGRMSLQEGDIFTYILLMTLFIILFSMLLCYTLYRNVLKPLGGEPLQMQRIAKAIAAGDLNLAFKEDSSGVYQALQLMTKNLLNYRTESENRAWLQQGLVSIDHALRKEHQSAKVAQNVLRVLARYMNAQVGALYLWQEGVEDQRDGQLKKVAGFAEMSSEHQRDSYRLNQGLVGQAGAEQERVIIEQVPEGYMTICSGCGESAPAELAFLPFSYRGQIRGVIELGFFNQVSPLQCELLEALRESLGISFENISARESLNQALAESQTLSAELQHQQEELRISNENLRRKSYDLEQQKVVLQQSKIEIETKAVQLEEGSRYKSEFLANMSHELRTPLNSLLILARSLSKNSQGNLSKDEVYSANVIQDSGKHLLELINHILDLSKVEAGCMRMNPTTLEIPLIITQMQDSFHLMAKEKGIELTFSIAADVPKFIVSDQMRIEQVLMNLIGNGIKFTAKGCVDIQVSFAQSEEQVHFAVTDSGIGVADDKQEVIFNAFQQADGSTTREYGGTGLGLSISRELATLLGGSITLVSQLREGSTFTLALPLELKEGGSDIAGSDVTGVTETGVTGIDVADVDRKSPEPHTAFGRREASNESRAINGAVAFNKSTYHDQACSQDIKTAGCCTKDAYSNDRVQNIHRSEISSLTSPQRGPKRTPQYIKAGEHLEPRKQLLIIEDDPHFAKILTDVCFELDIDITLCENATEGLNFLNHQYVDGIILDFMLPDMEGCEVLNWLQRQSHTQSIPVYLTSALDDLSEAACRGSIGKLVKPTTDEDILQMLATLLDAKPIARQKLLVVEDDISGSLAPQKLLEIAFIDVEFVQDGAAAMAAIVQQQYVAVILDLSLPDISGLEVMQTLRQQSLAELPPFIIYTARDLSNQQIQQLQEFTQRIVMKNAESAGQLMDEVEHILSPPCCLRKKAEADEAAGLKIGAIQVPPAVAIDLVILQKTLQWKTAIVIDDDMRSSFALAKILRGYGMRVEIAPDVGDSLMAMTSTQIDLVLLDSGLLATVGYQIISHIREKTSIDQLPVFVLSTDISAEDKEQGLVAGAVEYLTKPIDLAALQHLLLQCL